MSLPFSLTEEEQRILGNIAEQAIDDALDDKDLVPPPADTMPASLQAHLGCFVTLNLHGQLRGCMGLIQSRHPLCENVWRMALFAAFKDERFYPLNSFEWPGCDVTINVLGPLSPCPDVKQIVIGRHGLVLRYNGHTGVFLPSVPVEQNWTLPEYLSHLSDKAGLPDDAWTYPEARLDWYESFSFHVKRGYEKFMWD